MGRLNQALFLTPAAKKNKTQARNSSQKLKEKTQPQGGGFLQLRKTEGKNSALRIFLKKLKGLYLLRYFYYKILASSGPYGPLLARSGYPGQEHPFIIIQWS